MAVGTYLSDAARISSPKPGSSFWHTAAVASGVTSRGAGPGAARRHHQAAARLVGHAAELGLDHRLLVGHHLVIHLERRGQPLAQQRDDRLAGRVLVDAGAGAVGDIDDADLDHGRLNHGCHGCRDKDEP